MLHSKGNLLVWFTGQPMAERLVGQELHLRGTVKQHALYEREAQTVLARVQVVRA